MKFLFQLLVLLAVFTSMAIFPVTAVGAEKTTKTVIKDKKQKKKLLGKHMFSLQWISWKKFGTATVTEKNGILYIKGEQKGKGEKPDFVTIDGIITEVSPKSFKFNGEIITRVSHINNGDECKRTGDMSFAIKGKRKYWRLVQMKSPCSVVTDYVDIFF